MTNSITENGISTDAPKRWFEDRAKAAAMVVGCLLLAGAVIWKVAVSGIDSSLFFLLLLACPLIHFFLHGGHGREEGHEH